MLPASPETVRSGPGIGSSIEGVVDGAVGYNSSDGKSLGEEGVEYSADSGYFANGGKVNGMSYLDADGNIVASFYFSRDSVYDPNVGIGMGPVPEDGEYSDIMYHVAVPGYESGDIAWFDGKYLVFATPQEQPRTVETPPPPTEAGGGFPPGPDAYNNNPPHAEAGDFGVPTTGDHNRVSDHAAQASNDAEYPRGNTDGEEIMPVGAPIPE
jgi:hypothetical protein